jgi:thiol-disulfide isomerase/thioredoxin
MRRSRVTGFASRLSWESLAITCLGLALLSFGCNPSQSKPDEGSPEASPDPDEPTPQAPVVEQEPAAAARVLERMVAAYKNASSYADAGTLLLKAKLGEGEIDESVDLALSLVRPNKIRMEAYEVMFVSDGRQVRAAIEDLRGQVLAKQAPEELTMEWLSADPILMRALDRGVGTPWQLILLLDDDPLKLLQQGVEETVLGTSGTIDGRDHFRVELRRAYATTVLWIDQETYVLRRIVFPTDEMRRMLAREGPVESVSLVAEFEGAQLGVEVDATAFEFEVPAGAELVKFFVPPDPARLLAKRVPDFKFVDLAGKPVTPESVAGKITVLEFWYTTCGFCRDTLPILDKVRQQYKDNPKLAFFAVSIDGPDVKNEALQQAFEGLGIQVPIVRDPEQQMFTLFNTEGTPCQFIIDAKGVVQHFEVGVPQVTDLAADLSEKLEKLLAGEDIYREPLEAYRARLQKYERLLEGSADSESPGQPGVEEIEIPRARIAERSEPSSFKLARLWECTELTSPGNILVVEAARAPTRSVGRRPRLLVVDASKSVAEVGLDGKLIANDPLDIEPTEAISNFRTAAGADGRRYFALFSFAQQRFHLFDQSWKLLFSFPEDALENNHAGIADVQLADLDRDGNLEAYVGYRDVVGLQRVSLEGERLWSNRSVIDVGQIAVDRPDAQAARRLVCTSRNGALTMIDAEGQRLGEIALPDRFLHRIVAADLDGDGQPEWCGLAAREDGRNVAVGLNLAGKELWSYVLPVGAHRRQIEPIVAGRLSPDSSGQWLLPGADGSIHVIAADGKLLDSFHYGAELTGLATTELDGKPVLIVATPKVLEAWIVE